MLSSNTSETTSWLSYFSKLSPVPAFPEYTGPHKVGSVDVEVPVNSLQSPGPAPENAADIHTIQCRIFYPATVDSNETRVPWIPSPQRATISAFTRFLGVKDSLAEILSFLPRHLNFTTIPAHKRARVGTPNTKNGRWPTMIFSHGLGGSRNAYSYIAGSLASHGMIVICPEHRDGSAITTFISLPKTNDGEISKSSPKRCISYVRISHDVTPEVYEAREAQLRVRLWELGLLHQALLSIDNGIELNTLKKSKPVLSQMAGKMHIHEPGSLIFGGHSFGAATTVQFVKSVYYTSDPDVKAMEKPLYAVAENSDLHKQVIASTPMMLLDMWCLPLLAPNSAPLFNLPLPSYSDTPLCNGSDGFLSIESESFYKWKEHLNAKARVFSPNPKAKVVSSEDFRRADGSMFSDPNFFYVTASAHLSQSDFGILFPLVTKRIFEAEEPERALRLNLRAQLQFLRLNKVEIARTSTLDLMDGGLSDPLENEKDFGRVHDGVTDDQAIFNKSSANKVGFWEWIDIKGMGESNEQQAGKSTEEQVSNTEASMEKEVDPVAKVPRPSAQRTFSAMSSVSIMSQVSAIEPVPAA